MAITYLPSKILRRVAKKKDLKKVITSELRLNKEALKAVSSFGVLTPKKTEEIALRVLKSYKKKYDKDIKAGESKEASLKDAVNKNKRIVQRLENATVYEIAQDIKVNYHGEKYEWLPSDSVEPDPEHQLKYGKVYTIGVGEMPGDRYGCKCGMRILTEEETLLLE